jgi:hypothetical protein
VGSAVQPGLGFSNVGVRTGAHGNEAGCENHGPKAENDQNIRHGVSPSAGAWLAGLESPLGGFIGVADLDAMRY